MEVRKLNGSPNNNKENACDTQGQDKTEGATEPLENEIRVEWSRAVDRAIVSGVTETEIWIQSYRYNERQGQERQMIKEREVTRAYQARQKDRVTTRHYNGGGYFYGGKEIWKKREFTDM